LDNDNEYEEEIFVEKPPGIDKHCPMESLKWIYQSEKQAPRYGIVDILKVDSFVPMKQVLLSSTSTMNNTINIKTIAEE
jgi:hypothetical protein